jgi:hypothetical protein
MGEASEEALTSASSVVFAYSAPATVLEVPRVAVVEGGSVLSVVTAGVADGSKAWCRFGANVYVAAGAVDQGIVECVSVAGVMGNTTVEVSANGQEFTSTGMLVENIALANVTSVMPGVVPVAGGSTVMIRGVGLEASGAVYCGFGASSASEAWSVAVGSMMASGVVSCVVPPRSAGFRALEVALSKDGEMSRSGRVVEYAGVGEVTSVQPSSGVVTGGTVVTVAGTGFVAGRTACKIGSSAAFTADVMSSTEARCVAPAGTRGAVTVAVAMGDEAALVSASS